MMIFILVKDISKHQYVRKEEEEELANYIETMAKEDLEILKQSLVQHENSNKKGYYRENNSPERAMEVEEDENINVENNFDEDEEDIRQKNYYSDEEGNNND